MSSGIFSLNNECGFVDRCGPGTFSSFLIRVTTGWVNQKFFYFESAEILLAFSLYFGSVDLMFSRSLFDSRTNFQLVTTGRTNMIVSCKQLLSHMTLVLNVSYFFFSPKVQSMILYRIDRVPTNTKSISTANSSFTRIGQIKYTIFVRNYSDETKTFMFGNMVWNDKLVGTIPSD